MRMAQTSTSVDVVPAINVPTLIVHASRRSGSATSRTHASSPARSRMRGTWSCRAATTFRWFDPDLVIGEIREFLTGQREARRPRRACSRPYSFTDLVGSTAQAAELGDRRWRDLLEQHHATVRRELVRFDGAEVDTAGDGFFATFDGPARAIRCAQAIVDPYAAAGARRARRTAHRERSSSQTARSPGSPSISARASLPGPARRRGARLRTRARPRRGLGSRVRWTGDRRAEGRPR